MSIDTLRKVDGTYRRASYRTIRQAIKCGHTEHLQTERGIVAFRPFTGSTTDWSGTEKPAKGITIQLGGKDESFDFLIAFELVDAIRYAFEFLNGSLDTWLAPNDMVEVYANQAEREGYVLATIGDEAIIEYEMPGTTSQWKGHPAEPTSALRIVRTVGDEIVGNYKTASYNKVPKKWLNAIRQADMTNWLGMGQRSATRIPFPAE